MVWKYPFCRYQTSSWCLTFDWFDSILIVSLMQRFKEFLNLEMSFEGFIWPHFNQNSIMVKLRTNAQVSCPVFKSFNFNNKFSNINYRWLRQCKQSCDLNDKILPWWFSSKTFRISSDTKTSAISFLKVFGESIDREYWEMSHFKCVSQVVIALQPSSLRTLVSTFSKFKYHKVLR